MIYTIGSLRNPEVRVVANAIRETGQEVFDDWHCAGERADDDWREYEKARGKNYLDALNSHAAQHTFNYDKHHLQRADLVVMVMPAGKSCHLEFGWAVGRGTLGYIYFPEEPERWDVMHSFAHRIFLSLDELIKDIKDAPPIANRRVPEVRENWLFSEPAGGGIYPASIGFRPERSPDRGVW